MHSPRGLIEPGRASQTPEIGSPADRAGRIDASRESRVPRGAIKGGNPSDGSAARRWAGNGRKAACRVTGQRFQQWELRQSPQE